MPDVVILVDGRQAYTYEGLSALSGKSESALRSLAHRRQVEPDGHVAKNVPVYFPASLGVEVSQE